MKRVLSILLVMMLLLSACAAQPENTEPTGNTTTPPPSSTAPTTTEPPVSSIPPVTTVTPTDPPELNYQNPLTGVAIAEPSLQRPVAIMLNNIKAAMPQHGVSQADILYEVLAEGGITRCMGIFTQLESVEKVGAIRSARKYFIDLALGYGASYVHAGASEEAVAYLRTLKNMDLDAGLSATHFYRDKDRLNAGYALEHTLFSSGEKILDYAQQRKVTAFFDEEKTYGLTFDDEKVIAGQKADKVTVYFNMGGKPGSHTKSTVLTYNADSKLYEAAQHGGAYIDGNTKETVAFRNAVVLYTATSLQTGGKMLTIQTVGSGKGLFACNGQMVQINWSRKTVNDPLTFTLENGNPVSFGVGATYIAVVPTNATVNWE